MGSDSAATATLAVLEDVNRTHGTRYRMGPPLSGGSQSGAWLVRDDTDRAAVLKWCPDRSWAEQIVRASASVARVRRSGYPTPAWLAVGVTTGGLGYQVQEFVAGTAREHLTVPVAARLVDVLEIQAGLDPDPGRSWSGYLERWYREEWASTASSVRSLGPEGSALADACHRMIDAHGHPGLPGGDLVHGDFRLGNVMFSGDDVAGVVDAEALGSGTRVFDYATLLDCESADEDALALLVDAASRAAGPGPLARCVVHVFLDLVLFVRDRLDVSAVSPSRRAAELTRRIRPISTLL